MRCIHDPSMFEEASSHYVNLNSISGVDVNFILKQLRPAWFGYWLRKKIPPTVNVSETNAKSFLTEGSQNGSSLNLGQNKIKHESWLLSLRI